MNWNNIFVTLCLLFLQVIFWCEASHSKCFECINVCCIAEQGKAQELCLNFNETCQNDCIKFPFQHRGKVLSFSSCSRPDEMCFTAHGLMKYKVRHLTV